MTVVVPRDVAVEIGNTAQAVRSVNLPPSLAAMLREHQMASRYKADGDFVFASSTGTALGHRNVTRRGLDAAADKAGLNSPGLPRLRFHDARHTFASLLVAEGLNVVYVNRQLGHASADITLRVYSHLFSEAEHAAKGTAALEAGLGNLLETAGRNQTQPEGATVAEIPLKAAG